MITRRALLQSTIVALTTPKPEIKERQGNSVVDFYRIDTRLGVRDWYQDPSLVEIHNECVTFYESQDIPSPPGMEGWATQYGASSIMYGQLQNYGPTFKEFLQNNEAGEKDISRMQLIVELYEACQNDQTLQNINLQDPQFAVRFHEILQQFGVTGTIATKSVEDMGKRLFVSAWDPRAERWIYLDSNGNPLQAVVIDVPTADTFWGTCQVDQQFEDFRPAYDENSNALSPRDPVIFGWVNEVSYEIVNAANLPLHDQVVFMRLIESNTSEDGINIFAQSFPEYRRPNRLLPEYGSYYQEKLIPILSSTQFSTSVLSDLQLRDGLNMSSFVFDAINDIGNGILAQNGISPITPFPDVNLTDLSYALTEGSQPAGFPHGNASQVELIRLLMEGGVLHKNIITDNRIDEISSEAGIFVIETMVQSDNIQIGISGIMVTDGDEKRFLYNLDGVTYNLSLAEITATVNDGNHDKRLVVATP